MCIITVKLLSEYEDNRRTPVRERHNYKECQIFMIQIGNVGAINPMQACSIESVAFHHPNLTVCLAVTVRLIDFLCIFMYGDHNSQRIPPSLLSL